MSTPALLRAVDAVTIPVPDLDQGLAFYRGRLGHELVWRNDAVGQAALRLPDSSAELVLTTRQDYEVNWLVDSVSGAVRAMVDAGGTVLAEERQVPVGRLAVVADPFGNALVLLDLSAGTYRTDSDGSVTAPDPGPTAGPER
jgi:predicted enzyme related to lactoylglutathione lyase